MPGETMPRGMTPAPSRTRAKDGGGAVRRERGVSLIVAMLALVLIGLASTAIMRDAVSGDQVVTNGRLLVQAHQYAQVALRFCERQAALPPATRAVAILDARVPPAWAQPAQWMDGPAMRAHVLAADDDSSPIRPRVAPRCMVEATAQPGIFTVTARGFSPDFIVDPASGLARSGAVVWLQSTVLVADGGARIAQRVWQQLLTPPF
jgi:type IV pilus assembly protein PilX